ncbi:MAG: class I SAM-dependent methyltransferase [Prolixibacteraceae bacterium]|jgi:ubiquinone/menaquinone biosynthesis C-methylase UbiE|nr:class I SAM-dependent methyltransferase [Prolixibacteraceae bacterium]MBT6766051.1 class I SAM-dependent methyltransferase [Prolixibacteraceae bacterium]MBT6998641.1 class I SAM-dependent methyltransferase [Prolixibacteraceae bacterium]MBT7397442.1 class I SAM-dependent methyltransferase [Prolixibacteraceae bacterium]
MGETGWFYRTFIDPLLKSGRKLIKNNIRAGETVLDVACGTGALVFDLAEKAKKVVGVDFSESMLKAAQREQKKRGIQNIEFITADASQLTVFSDKEFDVVTLSMALHQFDPGLHSPILNEMKRVSKKIIIVDYAAPLPKSTNGRAAKFIEFLAGKEHNGNFKKFCKLGGLKPILENNDLQLQTSKRFGSGIFQITVCST